MRFVNYLYSKFTPDGRASNNGERQASQSLVGIRDDHIGRYEFAANYVMEGFRVLDMACGVGYGSNIIAMKTLCSSILAVDVDDKAIKFAKKHYYNRKIEYMKSDCLTVALPDNEFDLCMSFETIEHVERDKGLLDKFYSSLKPRGLLILSTPNESWLPYSAERFPFHIKHYLPRELEGLLKCAGFNIESVHSQRDPDSRAMCEGWEGLFNVVVCRKP